MAPIDRRRPAVVTTAFRDRLGHELAARGFVARAGGAAFIRTAAQGTHRVELSSSHHNVPGDVSCHVALLVLDPAIEALEPGWRAGGGLTTDAFADDLDPNIADLAQADALLAHVLRRLAFFDLLDDAPALLEAASRGYVPGACSPRIVVPHLRARLGAAAAGRYAEALLRGRPELWPSCLGASAPRQRRTRPSSALPDHGTELAQLLARHAPDDAPSPPAGTASSTNLSQGNYRSFLGLMLRAWGEPEAAGHLRTFDDAAIKRLQAEQERLAGAVFEPGRARQVLSAVTGEQRAPRRDQPTPKFFQYAARHGPFVEPAAVRRQSRARV
jgi:hypothetical protein